ncbi:MAG TPA: hypothetical protein VMV92_39915 [Streptosporangiaceae bacterium]|nr:hypothetical protein [Streptosporangiaceae bacterium]
MTPTRTGAYTDVFREQYGTSFTEGLAATAAAATTGDWKQATILASRLQAGRRHLHHSVVRDALAAGLDWQTLAELLTMHPQAAFEEYANLLDGTTTPAQQRPHLVVLCTVGLAADHDMSARHGIDLDDLDPQHSLTLDPTVVRLREAAKLLGEDIWIAVKLPGAGEGDDDLPGGAASRRWTTVVLYPDELGWLREAPTLNAVNDNPDGDEDYELDPL